MTKKLIRPKKGRILFGVAEGLGNHFEIDPVIIRLLFVILAIWGGSGIILYIIAIFLMPDENHDTIREEIKNVTKDTKDESKNESKTEKQKNSSAVFGMIILLIGLIFLLSNFIPGFSWGKLWPIILIFFGLLILADSRKG